MKKKNRVLFAALLVFLLTGCGKTAVEKTTIVILKDGSIEHTIVEDFGEESVDALKNMMSEKAALYNSGNSAGGAGVTVDEVEAGEGVVKVVMTYPDAASFDGFMNMDVMEVDPALRAPFFYGTVEEAYAEGFDLEIELHSAEDDGVLQGKEDILSMGKNGIIIYDNEMNLGAPVQITAQYKPIYISENVTVAGKNAVEISGKEQLAYILLNG